MDGDQTVDVHTPPFRKGGRGDFRRQYEKIPPHPPLEKGGLNGYFMFLIL